ncbi:MAG: GNAT family N-acetyltransferase [Planctomycetota bacterium]
MPTPPHPPATSPPIDDPGQPPWDVRAPGPGERGAALSLLLTGRATGGEAAVRRFDDYLARQQLGDAVIRSAWSAGRPIATAAAVINPGRAAMLFLSRPRSVRGDRSSVEAVLALLAALPPSKVRLAQALLEPGQMAERRVLAEAGMSELAVLAYLSRSIEASDRGVAAARSALTGDGLRLEPWTPQRAGVFADAVERSYEDALDCPGLRGVRPIEDVMAGHRAAGRFDPGKWVLATDDAGAAAGVMLLSELPSESAGELVYIGVPAAWRRRGVAGRLLRLGIAMAAEAGLGRLLLAVDQANAPGLRLYRGAGLVMTGRRHAWMHVIGEPVVS